jgi:hypothetical protein
MIYAILIGTVLMAAAIYIPFLQTLFDTTALPLVWVLGVLGVAVFNILTIEFGKWIFRKKNYD